MFNRTNILRRGVAAASSATVLVLLAAPAQAADEPRAADHASAPPPAAPIDGAPQPPEQDALAAMILELVPSRLTEMAGIFGDPAHREAWDRLARGVHGPPSALENATGGGDEHPSAAIRDSLGLPDESEGASSIAEGRAGSGDPAELMRGFATADGSQTNAAHDTGSSYRPAWGKGSFPKAMGPVGSSTAGTRIGGGSETTRTDPGKKGKSPWKIIYVHEGTCGAAPLCNTITVFYADGHNWTYQSEMGPEGATLTETVQDGTGAVYWELVEVRDENGDLMYETVNGEAVDDEEVEQPLPEGGTEPTRADCLSLPTSRDECGTQVSLENQVSQPGHGHESGSTGGFDPSIQERVDVATQPTPTGGGMAGGGAGGGPGHPGSGGSCTTCG